MTETNPDPHRPEDVGVASHRDWHWQSPGVAHGPADLSPGCELWLAIGDEPPERVTVLHWLRPEHKRFIGVRAGDGREYAVGRLSAWFVGDDGPVADLTHGETVQVSTIEDGHVGASLPMGHVWPPDATPPEGPPARGGGRRA